jgi:RNA polymerase-interacting CarD/CdnL/TRCF family regulator
VIDPTDKDWEYRQLAILKAHCKLQVLGMKHSSLTMTDLVEKGHKLGLPLHKPSRAGLRKLITDIELRLEQLLAAEIKEINNDKD